MPSADDWEPNVRDVVLFGDGIVGVVRAVRSHDQEVTMWWTRWDNPTNRWPNQWALANLKSSRHIRLVVPE